MTRMFVIFLFLSCACVSSQAQDFNITTISGTDTFGYNGDGFSAANATLYYPEAINLDRRGNLYIADVGNERIRKITLSTGIISTVAGVDTFGFSGDGGPATNAELYFPVDVCTDFFGNIYIAELFNNTIRKVTVSTGIITTIAGLGPAYGYSGDGGPATNALLNSPSGLCVDKFDNIYIADYYNNKVRKIDANSGTITTFAGTGAYGYSGDNGPATAAEFNGAEKVYADNFGNIFISDQYNFAVRKVDVSTGIITTIAGTGIMGYSGDGGAATRAKLNQPGGGFFDRQNNLYIADYDNGAIRKIDAGTGIISTVSGKGIVGFSGDGGPATVAQLWPDGVVLDSNGIMYVADYDNHRIRMVYDALEVKPLAAEKEISVCPNPALDELNVVDLKEQATARLLTITGVCVYQGIMHTGRNNISLRGLALGIYILELNCESGHRKIFRLMKE